MNPSTDRQQIQQEAQMHRCRIDQLMIQMQRQGALDFLLDDFSWHHKRLVHLQDHYGV